MPGLADDLKRKAKNTATWMLITALLLSAAASDAFSQENVEQAAAVKHSIEESLRLEKELLAELEQEKNQIQELTPSLAAEIKGYKILHTTYTNLLAAQQVPDPYSLEEADKQVKAALIRIRGRLDALNKQLNAIQPLRTGLNEQQAINTAYLKEIRKSRKDLADNADFIKNLQALIDVIHQKRRYLDKIYDFCQSSIGQLQTIEENLTALSARIDTRVNESRKSSRLIRRTSLITPDGRKNLIKETESLFGQLQRLLSFSHIKSEAGLMWKSGGSVMVLPVLLFALVMMLAVRLRSHYPRVRENPVFENCPAFRLAWRLFNRSAFLLIITIFLYLYVQADGLYVPVHFVILSALLQIYLFTKWGLDILSDLSRATGISVPPALHNRLRALFMLIRCYLAVYLFMAHLTQSGGMLLPLARLVFEILLVAWCLEFWRTVRRRPSPAAFTKNDIFRKEAIKMLAYVISIGGLVFEITGYGGMSFFWYAAWSRTLVLGMWAVLLYLALRELSLVYQVKPDLNKEPAEASGAPVTWLFLKLGQPLVLLAFLAAVILAWGGKRVFLLGLIGTMGKTYRIGSIELSLMGFIYALIVLLITHIIALTWRHVFQRKLLAKSGMVVGLQESLTTISVYVLWALGVLIALNFIGMNSTTLAVAFGAVGIGLGFGLQNIFNNFVSGIILLLERPIQIGDDIQINDTWATVRKINVRSTVVQTYDNASLIIPNSDLISNQVINWSFKDKRLRRNILVGVAYGSDIELVRQTLMEAAAGVPRVLKQPKPDVVFKDFGDSALLFNLRIWTHIAYFLSVETDVRFAIDRLFREKNIVIPFPQRDIHMYHDDPPRDKG